MSVFGLSGREGVTIKALTLQRNLEGREIYLTLFSLISI